MQVKVLTHVELGAGPEVGEAVVRAGAGGAAVVQGWLPRGEWPGQDARAAAAGPHGQQAGRGGAGRGGAARGSAAAAGAGGHVSRPRGTSTAL